jgi:hypothetical protein
MRTLGKKQNFVLAMGEDKDVSIGKGKSNFGSSSPHESALYGVS